ncbi:MAG: T9SS type A sorting domain-containing protein [Tannerella sp.]|jgi:hypothetical protein|nr:T9SS type A sorting domain-containing protein [Tannerella sp.]
MKQRKNKNTLKLLLSFLLLLGLRFTVSAQLLPGYLFGMATIGENPTLLNANLVVGNAGEMFLGTQQTNTLYLVGKYSGEAGARSYHAVTNNSNASGTRGFMNIAGTATGSTEIILDMFNYWDGSDIDLARAYLNGSEVSAFTMQEADYNGHHAVLKNRIEGNDIVWYISRVGGECLDLIIQKKNHTLEVNNNAASNGGYKFVYYDWYKNNVLIHSGAYGEDRGGYYYTGSNAILDTTAEYYVIATDQYGITHQICPYQPKYMPLYEHFIVYPNPVTKQNPTTIVDIATQDTELLQNGVISLYNFNGVLLTSKATNGHQLTPIELPQAAGVYILRFVSGNFVKTEKIIVNN